MTACGNLMQPRLIRNEQKHQPQPVTTCQFIKVVLNDGKTTHTLT